MVTATIEQGHQRVLDITNTLIRQSPRIVQDDSLSLLQKHRWWLREADRHATNGFYDGGEFTTLELLNSVHYDDSEIARAERRLEELLLRTRWVDLYDKVRDASYQLDFFTIGRLGLPALLDGTYENIIGNLHTIINNSGIADRARSSTDVLLPKNIMKMNYPFSHIRRLTLPPTPADLRVLCDWEISFRDCFDAQFLMRECHERSSQYLITRNLIRSWVLDLTEPGQYSIAALATFNGMQGRIDFAVQQGNMHKKFWLYKAQKVCEYFDGKYPMLIDPRELYNAARRAVRRTHSYLQSVSKEFGAEYHTFPPKINP